MTPIHRATFLSKLYLYINTLRVIKVEPRDFEPLSQSPNLLHSTGTVSIVHAFVHVCNFQRMQCQRICVGSVTLIR